VQGLTAGGTQAVVEQDINQGTAITGALSSAIPIAGRLLPVGVSAAQSGSRMLSNAGAKLADNKLVSGVKDVAQMTAQGIGNIPSRVATNVAEKQVQLAVVKSLPTKVARKAAQDGIDANDVAFLYNTTKANKPAFSKLAKVAKDFAENPRAQNPIEIVGQPIVNRIKELNVAKGTIGQKLGAVADTLGSVTTKEVGLPVFTEIKKVPGLSGLTVNSKGVLNFENTSLALKEAKPDRKAIQQLFLDAIKNGTGKQKHLLRQGLWEVLGGKKGKVATTGTQEKAYEAIRKGLSNVLDTKNGEYKRLNTEFAKVAQPISDMQKFLKSTSQGSIDDDILNMKAGVLARRLTGASPSGSDIRAILKAMDAATAVKGKSRVSVENLQDFYNILNKYYDIAGKTSFQGQIKLADAGGSSFTEVIGKGLQSVAGQTPAVRQKALEDALKEALK